MERQGELAHVARCDTAQTGGRLEPSESCLDSGALVSAPDAFAHKLPFSSDPPISTVAYQVLCYPLAISVVIATFSFFFRATFLQKSRSTSPLT